MSERLPYQSVINQNIFILCFHIYIYIYIFCVLNESKINGFVLTFEDLMERWNGN